MCVLTFDYDSNPTHSDDVFIYPPVNVPEEQRREWEEIINNKYAPYCHKINKEDGKVIMKISQDGKRIMGYDLVVSIDLHKEIYPSMG
jgi:hypothetical protein